MAPAQLDIRDRWDKEARPLCQGSGVGAGRRPFLSKSTRRCERLRAWSEAGTGGLHFTSSAWKRIW